MKYFIIAGEASGDMHAANLIRALRHRDRAAVIRAWGGDQMQEAGASICRHISELAFMGFWEVLKNLRTILGLIKSCKADVASFNPDVLILVDYPGFNLRMATWAARRNIRVFYYISPQLWAWKASRIKRIRRDVERMYVILPFEKSYYASLGMEVDFVGHPLLDEMKRHRADVNFRTDNNLGDASLIALLPGSRKQEISSVLPVMLKMVPRFPEYTFVIGGIANWGQSFYEQFGTAPNLRIVFDNTYGLLSNAHAALVTSGTATLETGLYNVPEIVCYRGNPLSYWLARRLVKVDYISLVNLILKEGLLTELLQGDLNEDRLFEHLSQIVKTGERRNQLLVGLEKLQTMLCVSAPREGESSSSTNSASENAAILMIGRLSVSAKK